MPKRRPHPSPDDGLTPRAVFGDDYKERLREQISIIQEDLGDVGIGFDETLDDPNLDNADPLYLYNEGVILVRDEDIPQVSEIVGGRRDDSLIPGVTRWRPAEGTIAALKALDRVLGVGAATPDHILYITEPGGCCPATEPEEPPNRNPYPSVGITGQSYGRDVLVSVIDTGWLPAAANHPDTPWLRGVTGDEIEIIANDIIKKYQGHGTFVAGVVRSMAPAASVRVEGFLAAGGAIAESNMVAQLYDALDHGPDILSISAGTYTRNHDPLLSFEVFWKRRLRHCKGTALVAAAGNDATRHFFWPAAFPWAVSVGALDGNGDRSDFSNFGSWVDLYALGRDLVNAYATGTYTTLHKPPPQPQARQFDGLAQWSGTSFSTPIVSGLIAARMSQTGESARRAADELLRIAQINAKPGVGARIGPGFQL